jgi:hypothetical protein
VDPPSASTRYGAVGNNWNTDAKTVNVKPNMMRNRGVNNRLDIAQHYTNPHPDERRRPLAC